MGDTKFITRIIFGTLCCLALGYTIHLALSHQGQLAAKVSYIAAILFIMTIKPPPSPFATTNKEILLFYRNRLGAMAVIFFPVAIFIVFWVLMPHERIPHFDGTIVAFETIQGDNSARSFPVIEYEDSEGEKHKILDKIAPIMFPKRQFQTGEEVSVIARKCNPGIQCIYIDEPFLTRWWGIFPNDGSSAARVGRNNVSDKILKFNFERHGPV